MSEEIYVILLDGKVYRKDSAIRTYKTRERAIKESKWFVERGRNVIVGRFAVVNTEVVVLDDN